MVGGGGQTVVQAVVVVSPPGQPGNVSFTAATAERLLDDALLARTPVQELSFLEVLFVGRLGLCGNNVCEVSHAIILTQHPLFCPVPAAILVSLLSLLLLYRRMLDLFQGSTSRECDQHILQRGALQVKLVSSMWYHTHAPCQGHSMVLLEQSRLTYR